MDEKIRVYWKYGFGIAMILLGGILSYFKIGNEFLGFSSVGSWLLYVGIISLAIATVHLMGGKKRIVDERMQFVATKASRITFIALLLFAFIIMIIDGIKPITVSYAYFMSYLVCGMVIVYLVSYKLLLRVN